MNSAFMEAAPFPRCPGTETIIYETHVRGLSIHPGAMARHPGSYRGVIEKLPYLADLRITSLEPMPVFEFNVYGAVAMIDPVSGERLRNYWGCDPLGWFAPKASYSSAQDPAG